MASKPVPVTTTPTGDSPIPSITAIKKATCKTTTGKSTLTYRLGIDKTSALHWQVLSNSGNGYHSDEWLSFQDIQKALSDWAKDFSITSMALKTLFQGKSANTPGFLIATLVKEGILEPVPDSKRHYQLCEPADFLAEMDKLTAAHSKSVKPKPKTKAKAAARMPKKAKPPATPSK